MGHILFLHHSACLGGAEFSLLELVEELRRRGSETTVVLPERGDLFRRFRGIGIEPVLSPIRPLRIRSAPISTIPFPFHLIRTVRCIVKIIRTTGITVIHANSIHACPYAIFAARLTGLPILWHNRDLVSHPWIHRALGRNVSQGIAISNSVAAHLRLQGIPTDRITTIRNGIRTDRFSGVPSLSRTEMNLPAAGPLVLMAGQFVPWKRHEDFIAAAALIARERPDARFIVAGAPLDSFQIRHRSELLKQIAAHDLSDVFVFSGFVSDMPSLYANCTCVAHPAVGEPFGRVVAEAMACGCPVVAVADSGPAELIQDRRDGLLVSPRSPESLAASVLRVLDDSALAGRLGAAAARRIRSDFSIERVGEEFLGLLNRVEKRGRQTAIHQGGKMRR